MPFFSLLLTIHLEYDKLTFAFWKIIKAPPASVLSSSKLSKPTAPVPHTSLPVTVVCPRDLLLFVFQLLSSLLFCFARPQSWFRTRPSARFSTSTARRWPSASVPPRGAGEGGCRRWSVLSSSPDPQLIIASRTKTPLLYFSVCVHFVCVFPLSQVTKHPFGPSVSSSAPLMAARSLWTGWTTRTVSPTQNPPLGPRYWSCRASLGTASSRTCATPPIRPPAAATGPPRLHRLQIKETSEIFECVRVRSLTSRIFLCQVCCLQQQRRRRGRAVGKMTCLSVCVCVSTECQ